MLNKDLHLNKDIFNANIAHKSTRQGFGDALLDLGHENDAAVVLTADLMQSTKVDQFADAFPERFIDAGVAEQNMVGIAAGLALSGKIPFLSSYAIFNPGRNWAQIRLSVCYSGANVKLVGTHAGFSPSRDGASHQALEDIALMRVLPRMTVVVAADYFQAKRAVEKAVKIDGPVYIRCTRDDTPAFTTEKTPFEVGKAQVLHRGGDVTIVATGPVVYEALLAARELKLKDKINADVINVHSIKPFDEATVIDSAKKSGLVVTLEEHQIVGGLGGLVSEILSEKLPTKVHKMGVKDTFGESGLYEELLNKHELSAKHIVKAVKKLLK